MKKSGIFSVLIAIVIWTSSITAIIASLSIVAYQVYNFLRYGYWLHLSLNNGIHIAYKWIYEENLSVIFSEWSGAQKILEWLPLSFSLFFIGALTALVNTPAMDD